MKTAQLTLSGGNTYAVDVLNPYEAIAWARRVVEAFGPALGPLLSALESGGDPLRLFVAGFSQGGENVPQLMRDAIARCSSPENKPLSDPEVFDSWFRKHPQELFELGFKACMEVAAEYLAAFAAYTGEKFSQEHDDGAGKVFVAIPGGWEATSMTARICKAGLCSYMDIIEGRVNAKDFFAMQRMVDWNEQVQGKIAASRKQ